MDPRFDRVEPARRSTEMTVEEILIRSPGIRRGQPVRTIRERPPRAQQLRYPPPASSGLIRWARTHPWIAAITAYAAWMLAWGAHIWSSAWV